MAYNIELSPRARLRDAGRGCFNCEAAGGGATFFLLKEDGDKLLLETSDKILTE